MKLIDELGKCLPDLGRHVAIDSKKIESHAGAKKDSQESSDPDADWGRKSYKGKRADGSLWEKITSWFGYKLHLVVDSTYELPVGAESYQSFQSRCRRVETYDRGCEEAF